MLLLFLACNPTTQRESTEPVSVPIEEHQPGSPLEIEPSQVSELSKPKLPPLLDITPKRTSIDPHKLWLKEEYVASYISIDAMGSIEHYTEEGYIPYPYTSGTVPHLKKKDRIWLDVSASKDAYLYVIAQHRRNDDEFYEKWFQTTMSNTEQLRLFPDGFEITEEREKLKKIYLIASLEPLEWLETLQTASCKTPDFEPEVCKILTALWNEEPARPKCPNCYPLSKRQFQVGNKKLTGALSFNNGEPFTLGVIGFKHPKD